MPGWDAGTHPGQAAGLAGQAGWRPQPLRGEAGWTWPYAPCSLHRYASRAYPGHAARRAWPLHHQVYRLPKPGIPAGTARDRAAVMLPGLAWQKVPCGARGAPARSVRCAVLAVSHARCEPCSRGAFARGAPYSEAWVRGRAEDGTAG